MKKNKMHSILNIAILGCFLMLCCACSEKSESRLFQKINSDYSGLDFENTITENREFSILNFHYIYNGGGVAVADFNNDGLQDVVFSGNQVPSRIYLNKGNLKFEEISDWYYPSTATQNSKPKNLKLDVWATGVNVVDINGDGWMDIYLSVGGQHCADSSCKNQLFVHKGLDREKRPIFKEMAHVYGLDDGLYNQQAAFLDVDKDGDLDAFLLHNVIDKRNKNAPSTQRLLSPQSVDRLLLNEWDSTANHPIFIDKSFEFGIAEKGYGLGVTVQDFDADGWPDIYVANDFLTSDLLYRNKGVQDGAFLGFENVREEVVKHCSYNSMGVDVADLTADGLPEILVVDMLPETVERKKSMLGFMNYNKFRMTLQQGYAPQFIRNTLQKHNGFSNGAMLPFSEIGAFSGIAQTDWSWSPLMADFDNDGDRDIFITNGYGKDITDLDFIAYSNEALTFGTPETVQERLHAMIDKMKHIKIPNYIFEQTDELKFEKRTGDWMDCPPSISNGAVFVDLDNDGDLDILTNNINDPVFLYENTSETQVRTHYLQLKLKGNAPNTQAIGAKVRLWSASGEQYQYHNPTRGYLSAQTSVLHFGLGKDSLVQRVEITWPNGKRERHEDLKANQFLTFEEGETAFEEEGKKQDTEAVYFKRIEENSRLRNLQDAINGLEHQENPFSDFDRQILLTRQLSRQGPCIAVADLDGDSVDEVFVGGAKGRAGRIFYKNKILDLPKPEGEDVAAEFFDVDGDGDLDLYVVRGGSEWKKDDPQLQDLLFENLGNGQFAAKENALPDMHTSGSCLAIQDIDDDGDLDVFVGGRLVPNQYPKIPKSYLLVNEKGIFQDKTKEIAPDLAQIGMISDAKWTNIKGDSMKELLVVGEWMRPQFFEKNGQNWDLSQPVFIDKNGEPLQLSGLWYSLGTGDFDGNWDENNHEDLILGNIGENVLWRASEENPLRLVTSDLDKNGSPDPLIITEMVRKNGDITTHFFQSRDDVVRQLTAVKKNTVSYADFGRADAREILSQFGAYETIEATTMTSYYCENLGDGKFYVERLPTELQYAPIQEILVHDFESGGHLSVLISQNDLSTESTGGYLDAGNGHFLRGSGTGYPALTEQSGFFVKGSGNALKLLRLEGEKWGVLVGQNRDKFNLFEVLTMRPVKFIDSKMGGEYY